MDALVSRAQEVVEWAKDPSKFATAHTKGEWLDFLFFCDSMRSRDSTMRIPENPADAPMPCQCHHLCPKD